MALTDTAVRNAKSGTRDRKLFDRDGLFLLLTPKGKRYWRFKYRFQGREKLLSLGVYPEISLKEARERRDAARKLVAKEIDPSEERKTRKAARGNTFEVVAREWLALQEGKLATTTYAKAAWMLLDLIAPYLGKRPIAEITSADLLQVLRRIEKRGKHETAHRVKQRCGQVFRYAIATGRAENDPTGGLKDALAPVKSVKRAAITDPAKVGALLRAIDDYDGYLPAVSALRLLPLVFVRPGELRMAEWGEIDLDAAEWRIPAERMKMREQHIVPLSRQAVAILREVHPLTGRGRLVFPSVRSPTRSISENTLNAALRRLGYAKDEMTSHGFRAMASTLLNERAFPPDVIELQLAHAERNKVRAAYNRAERLAERRTMMQAWADYLDDLKAGAKVIPLTKGG
jgi:integrase